MTLFPVLRILLVHVLQAFREISSWTVRRFSTKSVEYRTYVIFAEVMRIQIRTNPEGPKSSQICKNAEVFKLNKVFILLIPSEIRKTNKYVIFSISTLFYPLFSGRFVLPGSAWRLMRIQDPQHWFEVCFRRWIPWVGRPGSVAWRPRSSPLSGRGDTSPHWCQAP